MIRRLGTLVVVASLAAAFSSAAVAQWKWRDKNGQMHISDTPPPAEVADKDVLQRPGTMRRTSPSPAAAAAPASAPAAARAASDPELEARMRRVEQERQAQQKREDEKVAAARAENCARAKDAQRTLDSGVRLVRTNEKGEREVLDDKQRAEEIQRARNIIASDCR